MSDYVVHFTKPGGGTSAYGVMLTILYEGQINASGPFGDARKLMELGDSQKSACFSEIPLDLLGRLIERRSPYGIGFHQRAVLGGGGGRVWYLDRNTPAAEAFQEIVRVGIAGRIDTGDAIWKLTPLVDKPGDYAGNPYRFEWEREWRVPGGLSFSPGDVAFLFIPEELHAAAKGFFESVAAQNTGPAYLCPYIDPRWTMEQIQATLAVLEPSPHVGYGSCEYCGGPNAYGLCMLCGMMS